MTSELIDFWSGISSNKGDFLVQPGDRMSYGLLAKRVRAACALFDAHGLRPGDRIVIALDDEPAATSTFIAALLDGLVPVMVSHEAHGDRQEAIAQAVGAVLRVDETRKPEAPAKGLRTIWKRGAEGQRAPRCPAMTADTLAYVLFTSGSTSRPRGVRITHGNLFSQLRTLSRVFRIGPGARIVNATPLAHTDGLVQGPLLAAFTSATLLRPGRFEVSRLEDWLDFIRGGEATHMIANPTLLSLILRFALETDWADRRRFQMIVCTGGVLSEALWNAFEDRFGLKVCNVYGMTESVANALFAGEFPEMGARGSIGCPIDCTARIAEDALEGELELHGPNISDGYWNDPVRTDDTRGADGWFKTGDVVRARADGSYDFLGRAKSVINQGAVRIYPEEIDEAFARHPNVVETVTLGLPDPDFEEIAVTAVRLKEPMEESELHAICNVLEPLKRPKRIRVLDGIPRTDTGKPDRIALASWFENESRNSIVSEEDDLTAKVIAIVADSFGSAPDKITLSATPDDIPGWDSFNHVKMIMALESEFGFDFDTREIVAIRSIKALVGAVKAHTGWSS